MVGAFLYFGGEGLCRGTVSPRLPLCFFVCRSVVSFRLSLSSFSSYRNRFLANFVFSCVGKDFLCKVFINVANNH